MVKKKGQKNAQSKKKLDLAAAVATAEQGGEEEEEDDLSQLSLNESLGASAATKTENGSTNDDETGSGNEGDEEALVMNYNPPEEGPVTEETGKTLLLLVHVTDYQFMPDVVQSATPDHKPPRKSSLSSDNSVRSYNSRKKNNFLSFLNFDYDHLRKGFRATLKLRKFKVALNSLRIIF